VKEEWLFYIAIGVVLVFVGALVDLLLIKNDVERIHRKFYEISQKIILIPLTKWQLIIMAFGYDLLYKITNPGDKEIYYPPLSKKEIENIQSYSVDSNQHYLEEEKLSNVGYFVRTLRLVFRVGVLISGLYGFFWVLTFSWVKWMFGLFLAIFMIGTGSIIVQEITHGFNSLSITISRISLILISTSFFSTIYTILMAFLAIYYIPSWLLDSYWFSLDETETVLELTHPLLVNLINYPFDFLTIFVTYRLLNFAIKTKRHIFIVAIIDLLCSYIFAVLLHTTFMIVSGDIVFVSLNAILESHIWLSQMLYTLFNIFIGSNDWLTLSQFKDIHLFPMIVSTFVPVFLYMSVFIVISILKPFLWVSSRLFHSISEKDESAFKQIGTVLSLMMAASKAIHDYWFIIPKK
jgi:hypothetical protein